MAYRYDGTRIQSERKRVGMDHCPDTGPVHDVKDMVSGGFVTDPADPGRELTTASLKGLAGGRWIYGVAADGAMRVAPDGDRGGGAPQVKHETLFHNADLEAAGEIQFESGIVTDINDRSGSYGTDNLLNDDGDDGRMFRLAVRKALTNAGAPFSPRVRDILHD